MEQNTARNFALQLGSLITLYVSITAILFVVFGVINVLFPDAASYPYEYNSAQEGIRMGIAMLVVFFPAFIILTRLVNKIRRVEAGTYMVLTKWLVYLSLLVGGAFLLGDVVAVILAYLNGELTTRFILKAAAISIVLAFALYYYIMDAKGYWITNEKGSKISAVCAVLLVILSIGLGISYGDSPSKVREMKIDALQVTNLQEMEWRIQDHYSVKKTLPSNIEDVYVGMSAPVAVEGRGQYTYTVIDEDSYKLCAHFAYPSMPDNMKAAAAVRDSSMINPLNNWDYAAGETCFERTVYKDTTAKPI